MKQYLLLLLLVFRSFTGLKCSEETSATEIKTENQLQPVVTAELTCEGPLATNTEESGGGSTSTSTTTTNTTTSAATTNTSASLNSMPLTGLSIDNDNSTSSTTKTNLVNNSNVLADKPIQANDVKELLFNDRNEIKVTTNEVESIELNENYSFNFKSVFFITLFMICTSFGTIVAYAIFKQRDNRIHHRDLI